MSGITQKDRPPLEEGQVWDGNVQDGKPPRALFRVLSVKNGRVRYEAPVGSRLDGYNAIGTMDEEDFRRYAWHLLDEETVRGLGG